MSEIEHVAMVLHGKFGTQVGLNDAEQWVPIARAAIEAKASYEAGQREDDDFRFRTSQN